MASSPISTRRSRRARNDEVSRRLVTVPGIGPISATAIAALALPAETLAKGRDFTAWPGLTPLKIDRRLAEARCDIQWANARSGGSSSSAAAPSCNNGYVRPRRRAGHMTASDHCLSRKKFLQAERHPHMRRPLQPEQQRGGQSDGSPAQCRDRKNKQALTQVSTRG
jgi:hypothetical protein